MLLTAFPFRASLRYNRNGNPIQKKYMNRAIKKSYKAKKTLNS